MHMPWRRRSLDTTAKIAHSLGELRIRHEVSYGPRPRPTYIRPVIINNEGMRWTLETIDCTNKYTVPVRFPVSHVTGRPADAALQAEVTMELLYL